MGKPVKNRSSAVWRAIQTKCVNDKVHFWHEFSWIKPGVIIGDMIIQMHEIKSQNQFHWFGLTKHWRILKCIIRLVTNFIIIIIVTLTLWKYLLMQQEWNWFAPSAYFALHETFPLLERIFTNSNRVSLQDVTRNIWMRHFDWTSNSQKENQRWPKGYLALIISDTVSAENAKP